MRQQACKRKVPSYHFEDTKAFSGAFDLCFIFFIDSFVCDHQHRDPQYAANSQEYSANGLVPAPDPCGYPEHKRVRYPHDAVCPVICRDIRDLVFFYRGTRPKPHRLFKLHGIDADTKKQYCTTKCYNPHNNFACHITAPLLVAYVIVIIYLCASQAQRIFCLLFFLLLQL